jgi:uncharacterized protein (DUF1810 family)
VAKPDQGETLSDEYDLARFVQAQDAGGTYLQALAELRRGRKVSHWMWFVFPQLAGLGRSATARRYAISSLPEARAYLDHEVLGPRLSEATMAVKQLEGLRAETIFGSIDAMKLHSCMTLFAVAATGADQALFDDVLKGYFAGQPDAGTMQLLPSDH